MNEKDREIALAIRKGASDTIARIRSDQTLSDYGKREQLLGVHKEATRRLRVEQARVEQRDTKRKADLERRLFGLTPHALGADVISYRDAVDRASRLDTAADADRLISRARATGDKALERAVFAHAYEMAGGGPIGRPWTELVDAYLGQRPDLRDDVNELVTCSSTDAILDTQMSLRMQLPAELNGHVDHNGELRTQTPAA